MGFKIMTADGWKEIPSNAIRPADVPTNIREARRVIRQRLCRPMELEVLYPRESDRIRRFKERMNVIASNHNIMLEERAMALIA